MVIPFSDCLARPPEEKDSLLVDHLKEVATKCGSPEGNLEKQFLFLAGLCHDAGKARKAWQDYIKKTKEKRRSGEVIHSHFGSVLFFFLGVKMIKELSLKDSEKKNANHLLLHLTLAIVSHHGALRDFEENFPESVKRIKQQVQEIDMEGLFVFFKKEFPLIENLEPIDFSQWLGGFRDEWERRIFQEKKFLTREIEKAEKKEEKAAFLSSRKLTGKLIAADRYHAAGIYENTWDKEVATSAKEKLIITCKEKKDDLQKQNQAAPYIIQAREMAQQKAEELFNKKNEREFFCLTLPTGLGKTLTSLRIALESVRKKGSSRIIYVAPYLAILSQATLEIEKFTGQKVLQHHHLSLVQNDELDNEGYLSMESWQEQIVATTFNQLFRALFPRTAQQTVRLPSLEKAFVIIDEPQIIDPQLWNVFLQMLKVISRENNMKVLFSTATMPGFEEGLGEIPEPLSEKIEIPSRYWSNFDLNPQDEKSLAEELLRAVREKGQVGVVLNTVKDAYLVYKETKDLLEKISENKEIQIFFISGLMTGLQKQFRIKTIENVLKENKKVIVISTQILEAGVDLSFKQVFRALPILPSIVQASGRANRHGEGEISKIVVFPFYQKGEKNTRKFIYNSPQAREVTDEILQDYSPEGWGEKDIEDMLFRYYPSFPENCNDELENTLITKEY